MKTLIHLCKKDFAFAKFWLNGVWVALALVAIFPAVLDARLAIPLLLLNWIAPLLLVFAATLKIMRGDPLTGSNGFLGTRPLSGPFLLATKLTSTAVFVLIPALLASMFGAIALRVDLSPGDYGLLMMEKFLGYGLAISVALLVGTHNRGIGMATVLTITMGVLLVWLFASIHGRPGGFQFIAEGRNLKTSQWLLTQALGDFTLPLLPSLGVTLPADHPSRSWTRGLTTWFQSETSRINDQSDRRASITGEATVELYQPVVFANLAPTSDASAVHDRFRYRIEHIHSLEGQISVSLSIRGVTLASRGDFNRSMDDIEIILIDPATGEHTVAGGSGGSSSTGGGLQVINKYLRLDDWPPSKQIGAADEFLQRARLIIIGRNYGGTVTLPYEIPEILLEEKPRDHSR